MTIYNAMLNISSGQTASSSTDESSDGTGQENTNNSDEDNYVDYEVTSENVDKTKTYMQTSTAYDTTGNYVTSETDESGILSKNKLNDWQFFPNDAMKAFKQFGTWASL